MTSSKYPIPSEQFALILLDWFDQNGRKDLPWQQDKSAYKVWISEIMLQQTQVKTVIPYFEKFMTSFPSLQSLATADRDDVLAHWSGLGYYARARNLHKSAILCVESFGGDLPNTLDDLVSLPGIGQSTAGAILSIAHQIRAPILDGNVKRVLSRIVGLEGWPGKKSVEDTFWRAADYYTPNERLADYTQAIMDIGATLCTRSRPNCPDCPFSDQCFAYNNDRIAEFPTKKPKVNKPTKHRVLLLLQNEEGELWLEKQPDKGIWGGLWSLPQIDIDKDTYPTSESLIAPLSSSSNSLSDSGHWRILSQSRLNTFTHVFSHFHLEISPIHIQLAHSHISEPALNSGNSNSGWKNQEKIGGLGIPAPIAKVLKMIDMDLSN